MAESEIQFLQNKLSRLLEERVNLQNGIKQDIENVKEALEAAKPFLRFNYDRYQDEARYVSWLKEVMDVAFDMEDALDEYLVRIANRPHYTCLGSICSSDKLWKAMHQTACERRIRSIKSRIIDIAELPKKYGYNPSPQFYKQDSSSATASTKDICQFRRNDGQLVGIDEQKKELVDWLNHGDPNLRVLYITGQSGQGKTTLAKQIYLDNAVTSHFKKRAFVTFSNPLKAKRNLEMVMLEDIIQQLFPFEMLMQQLPMGRLEESIRARLQNEKYFIVVDEVRGDDERNQLELAFPSNNYGSRIVIIVAHPDNVPSPLLGSQPNSKVYDLEPLSKSDSWTLFCKKAFPTQRCPSNLEPICQHILENCDGFPLAILAIGGLLATRDQHDVGAWEMVPRIADNRSGMLFLSFNDLPYQLKSCYTFLSIFPQDQFINSMRLIRLWISEGFVEEKDGSTLEEVARSYLDELLNRNLLQIAETRIDGRVRSCRIHYALLKRFLDLSRQERSVEVINREPQNAGDRAKTRRARRLSIHHVDGIKSGLVSRCTRSLILTKEDNTSSKMFKLPTHRFKLLCVLDLTGAPLCMFPEEISNLLLLRYLSLRNTKISKLPKSIGNLRRLETLDLKQTFVTELPPEISMLQKLRHLLISFYRASIGLCDMTVKISSLTEGTSTPYFTLLEISGLKVTPDIGGLLSLQKLCCLEASEDSGLIKVLGRLTQLRKLCLVNLREQHWSELCSSISQMRNLRSLTLHTAGSFDFRYISSPPLLLQRLYLTGNIDDLPGWMCSLENLQVLQLMFTRLKKDSTACLEGLPNLNVLVLCEAFDGVKTSVLPGSFSRLKVFGAGRQVIVGVKNANLQLPEGWII